MDRLDKLEGVRGMLEGVMEVSIPHPLLMDKAEESDRAICREKALTSRWIESSMNGNNYVQCLDLLHQVRFSPHYITSYQPSLRLSQ